MKNLVYELDDKIYVNLTNKCTNSCLFCIRNLKDDVVGADLWLDDEDIKFEDVIEQFKKFEEKIEGNEVVFCGYGEPLLKADLLIKIAKYLKKTYKNVRIRINTNGQSDLYLKKDITPELKGVVDAVSVSLNAQNEELYNQLSKPAFKSGAYDAMKNFTKNCVKNGIKASMSIVTGYKNYKVDKSACEKIAKSLGADFRVREWLENGY